MNKKMAKKLGISIDKQKLPPQLSDLISAGFHESDDGIFLAALDTGNTNVTASDFPDKTGYECFVNSIHIDDFVESEYLIHACLFVEACFDVWRQKGHEVNIRAIISSDESGAVVKIHVVREGESWVSQDLEKYEDAILVADSSLINLRGTSS